MFYIIHWAAFVAFIFKRELDLLIVSGLFAIASAISSLTYTLKKEKENGKQNN